MHVVSAVRGGDPPRVAFALALLAASAEATAHEATARMPWSFDPWVVALLAGSLAAYARGLAVLWRHAGRGRGVSLPRAACFAGGWAVLGLALLSPLDALGDRLFAAHMAQHELMMAAAAPLLVLGRPLAVWTWALPPAARRGAGALFRRPAWRVPWQGTTSPLAAWLLHAAVLWLWHVPAWFDAARASEALHAVQHASFLAAALLFWWSVLRAAHAAAGAALASLFTTLLHSGALGALLTLSPTVWYPGYAAGAATLGWSALDDQQLGGLVMWGPAGLAYVAAGLAVVWGELCRPKRLAW